MLENPEEHDCLIITEEEAGERLDKILASRFGGRNSRTYFQYLISEGLTLLNGVPVKKGVKPKAGDEVEIHFVATPQIDVLPEAIALDILYEDNDLLVINKPAGMVVHPAPGNWSGTFVNALLHHCHLALTEEPTLRPGIVHRLDKETSGVLVAAKNSLTHQRLIALFSGRKVYKEYLAVCLGNPGNAVIEGAIGRHPVKRKLMAVVSEGGKEARSKVFVQAFDGKLGVVKIIPETGRTHQIRVHLKHHGTPVLGDSTYGSDSANKKYKTERHLLHAKVLSFPHPTTQQMMKFEAPVPPDMEAFMQNINKGNQIPCAS